jgi:hypothetical protein
MSQGGKSVEAGDLKCRLPYELSPSPAWRSDQFLVFDALNSGPYVADIICELADDTREMHITLGLFPGLLTRVVLPFEYLEAQEVITGRTPHRLKCVCIGGPVDPGRLTKARLVGEMAYGDAAVHISAPQVADTMPQEWPIADRPIVDGLQQWADRDWPGKANSLDEVRERLNAELQAPPPKLPSRLDPWGGWLDRRFDATGFFRTENDGRRWWLVTPDGHAFYSVGVDGVRPSSAANTEGNEDLFEELPDRDGPFADCWRGRRKGKRTQFDGLMYNLMRAFGDGWFEKWCELCKRRLVAWGFNTVANWSHPEFYRFARLPYVWPLGGFPTTQKLIFRDFPDVFSDEYVQNSRRFAQQLEPLKDDQCQIGYFLRNEPKWAFGDYNMAEQMLIREERFASRGRFVEWLRERYGSAGALNDAWQTDFSGFGALAAEALHPDNLSSQGARRDMREFNRMLIDRYVRVPSEECRRVDPNHLNLGMRYAGLPHEDVLAGATCFDVFSINMYEDGPVPDVLRKCSEAANAPVVIGEFHTGALDRGLPWGGLRMVATQQERANSYRYFVEQGAALPEMVGAHYFIWNDQHVAGRHDGENWQIGVVDICQKPYEEFVAAARLSHQRLYEVASGDVPPFDHLPHGYHWHRAVTGGLAHV